MIRYNDDYENVKLHVRTCARLKIEKAEGNGKVLNQNLALNEVSKAYGARHYNDLLGKPGLWGVVLRERRDGIYR